MSAFPADLAGISRKVTGVKVELLTSVDWGCGQSGWKSFLPQHFVSCLSLWIYTHKS